MEELAYKVRIAVLWVLGIISFFAYRTIAISENATEVSVLRNYELANIVSLMTLFAFLSLVLTSRKWNRLTNIIAGAIFGLSGLILFINGIIAYPSASFNLMTAAMAVVMIAVVWLAFRWTK